VLLEVAGSCDLDLWPCDLRHSSFLSCFTWSASQQLWYSYECTMTVIKLFVVRGIPSAGAQNTRRVEEFCDFRQKSPPVAETVRD